MDSPEVPTTPSGATEPSGFRGLIAELRKRRIFETLAAFIGGGWLAYEIVHWILVAHYRLPEKLLDITIVTFVGALLITLVWRWFSGREKSRRIKPELVLIPLVLLATVLLDINLLLRRKGPEAAITPSPDWKNSIAVLPFVDMSPGKDQEYFCDGMTEDLINRLSNIRDLRVPARTSAFMFKGKTPDMREVGEKLKVGTALEGSIQKSGDRLRITAQLINIADGYHLWSERYDRELKDVFAIQDEIASAIVEALRLELSAKERSLVGGHAIDDAAAYELFLRARREIWRATKASVDRAFQDLQNALDIIGPNALLYSAMSSAYFGYVNIGARQEDALVKAEEYARKALALDPECSSAHHALGTVLYFRDPRESIRHYRRALELNPNNSWTLFGLALSHLYVGKPSTARPFIDRLKKVDPLNLDGILAQGYYEYYGGRFDLALDSFRKCYQSDPEYVISAYNYALLLARSGPVDEAYSIIDQYSHADPENVTSRFGLLLKAAMLKDKEKAREIMTPDFIKTCRRDLEWSLMLGEALALLDEKKEALDWLENAVDRGFINYAFMNKHDTFLDNLRGEERFRTLMERVKYEWEHFGE